jgi:hypothetical protein
MDIQTRTRLDNVLQHLSINGYSVFSLIHDILTRSDKRSNLENESINLLREGLERDAADICARLLRHDPVVRLARMLSPKLRFPILICAASMPDPSCLPFPIFLSYSFRYFVLYLNTTLLCPLENIVS